ncbi:hypothetical protein D3C77_567310 [compost metagenome]
MEIGEISRAIAVVGQPPIVPDPAIGKIEATAKPWNPSVRSTERLVELAASTPRIEAISHPPKRLRPVFSSNEQSAEGRFVERMVPGVFETSLPARNAHERLAHTLVITQQTQMP